jgi:hypothetical protein
MAQMTPQVSEVQGKAMAGEHVLRELAKEFSDEK